MSKITRQKRKENFTVVNNDILQNSKLSWAAKGMLVYLLHLPDNWQINVADLSNRSRNGRDGTAGIIKELMICGYISRVKIKNEKSQFKGYNYTVTDEPVNGKAVNGLSEDGSSVNGKGVTSKYYQEELLNELNTNEVNKIVEKEFSTVLIDSEEDLVMEIHHIPDYFEIEGNDEFISSKATQKPKEKVAPKRKGATDNPTPIKPMFDIYSDQYARMNGGEKPEFMSKYLQPMKKLYGILEARQIQSGIIPLDKLQPWRDFIEMWGKYLQDHPKETYFTANFNPATFYSQFNTIVAKLKNQPMTTEDKWKKFYRENTMG